MFTSIFRRMFWTYAIILVFVLGTISATMTILFTHFTEVKQRETVLPIADTIENWTATLQIEQKDEYSFRAYDRVLNSWAQFARSDITVVNLDGEVFDSTCGIKSVPEGMLECIKDNSFKQYKSDFGGFYDDAVLTIAVPLRYNDSVIGAIYFNRNLSDMRRTVLEMLLLFALSSAVSIIFAFLMVYYQARKISAPIAAINTAAQNIAAGNFSERVEVTSADETGQLASTFNFMASSIEKAELNRQRFISDVSHELRTPMTSISGFVEGMLDGTIDDEHRDDYLRIVLDESTRLTKLVNDMLEMSKLQSDSYKLDISAFDINNLICTCLISLESRLDEKQLEADVDFRPDMLQTLADKNQIKRVLINLLDNAVKFSIPGSVIKISTFVADGKAHVSISNRGENINDEDMRHLFDRFYKTDLSREKDRTGAGLGLSFVKNILRLHKQQINVKSVRDSDDKSTITFDFTLELA